MTLSARINSMMSYPPPYPEVRYPWMRKVLGLPPLTEIKPLIKNVSLSVAPGEVLSIVGPSAAGKTTLLRILAGLERRFDGQVSLDENRIIGPTKKIYLMPQAHTLLPWFSVKKNLRFAARNGDNRDPGNAIDSLTAVFALSDRRQQYPHTLSGGERARVALMCAMIAEPQVMLLDEPFRGLDQVTTEKCQDDLIKWLEETVQRESVVIVSHSISDAVFLGNRVIVVARDPLSVHREFKTPTVRERRSPELVELEADVFSALMEISAGGVPLCSR
jgi:NitT/TauT family transport system ATP-binding protein